MARRLRALALAAVVLLVGAPAAGHLQDFMARVVHVVPAEGALRVYVQMPLALVLLPQDWRADARQAAPPFLRLGADARLEVDGAALRRDAAGLRTQLAAAVRLGSARGTLEGARIENLDERDPFTYLPAVERSVGTTMALPDRPALELAQAVVSMRLRFDPPAPGAAVTLSGSGREWPALDARAVNIVRVHGADGSVASFQTIGPLELALAPPQTGEADAAAAPWPDLIGHVEAGFRHVLAGLDHVLFILVLLVGAAGPAHFVRTSLAFTLGHSVTLCLGAVGGLSALGWFVPAVEVAIAASIAWAGLRVLGGGERPLMTPAVLCIGLVHGFGFSFALEGAASALADNLAGLLIGFNIGIELGQVAISALAAPLLYLLRRSWPAEPLTRRRVLVVPCIATAGIWLVERSAALVQALPS